MRPHSEPLYNRFVHFFDNVRNGPRRLTQEEILYLGKLKREVQRLEDKGSQLHREVLPGIKVDFPFGLAAGPAYGSAFLELYQELGYGFLTQKTVRGRRWEANSMPHMAYLQSGDFVSGFVTSKETTSMVATSFGMHCLGPGYWEKDLRYFINGRAEVPLIVSVVPTMAENRDEAIKQLRVLSRRVAAAGASAVKVNVSCPNEVKTSPSEVQDNAAFCKEIATAVKQTVDIPLLFKIGFRDDYESFLGEVGSVVDGIAAVNSVPALVITPEGRVAFDERPNAGIAFEPLRIYSEVALKKLIYWRQELGDRYRIISIGGVVEPLDVAKRLNLGADGVATASGAITNPFLALETRKFLLDSKKENTTYST